MSFIKNYGLYWKRDFVNFGGKGPGNGGSLVGYEAGSEQAVDFKTQAGVYVLYDGINIPTLKVTYVGQVGRKAGDSLLGRLRDHHRKDHLWNRWCRFSWFGVYAVGKANNLIHTNISKDLHSPITGVIDHLEGALITVLQPALNKRGANWEGATQYFQEDDGRDNVIARLDGLEALVRGLVDKRS